MSDLELASNQTTDRGAAANRTLMRGIGDVAVMAGTPDFEMRVRRALSGGRGPRMVRWPISGERPDANSVAVVLIGPELPPDVMVTTAQSIDREFPGTYIVLVSDPIPGLLERALRAGVRDVVAPDAEVSTILELLARGLEIASERKVRAPVAAPVIDTPVHVDSGPTNKRRIITIVSPKGGVGKTLVAVNLACALGAVHRSEVALVDLDLQFGDVGASMHVAPEHTTTDAARGVASNEASLIKVFLSNHDAGVFVLCSPDDPADADDISYEQSVAIVRQLSTGFPFVVVDTAAGLDAHALSVAEASTDLVFLSSVDVASVRSLRKTLDAFDRLGMKTQRRHLIINRSDTPGGARPEDVETALDMQAICTIPTDRSVLATVNQGSPITYADPKSALARKFITLAEQFTEVPSQATGSSKPGLSRPWRKSR